ncbi:MAG TPA: TerC family protein [Bacteroidales bacterium]|nr:TerC family protein [Bacteroidales bacterium]
MGGTWLFWIGFLVFVLAMLALDLGVFHRKVEKVPVREAVIWTAIWISLAMAFMGVIYFRLGRTKALEFLTGYVIEYALSVDNIFVFILIFSFFKVDERYQHKVLFWGIIGALIMRGIFIFTGVALINRFHWIIYIFGGFLVYTGVRMLFREEDQVEPGRNPVVKFFRKILPVTNDFQDDRFFIRDGRKAMATPLFLVLIIIESSDLIFAVDSIPAILAITTDSFIVYTSNIFAILGLRSLYFAISGIMEYFRYLKVGLAFILTFVGLKMCVSGFFGVPIYISLGVIIFILIVSIMASIVIKKR